MTWLWETALSNAIAAVPLAVAVACISRLVRRPALTAALWTIVLLKFITPAVYDVRLPAIGAATSSVARPSAPATTPALNSVVTEWTELTITLPSLATPSASFMPSAEDAVATSTTGNVLVISAAAIWIIGSLAYLTLFLIRTARFTRLLRQAEQAPVEIRERTAELAARLGLRQVPDVRLTAGRVPPLLYVMRGRPVILLPADLWPALNDRQQSALLIHELAHYQRGDHWVRRLELLVRCLFWWHPVVWWAAARLHEAEEQCCDAWVVRLLPDDAPAYADALLASVDFLSTSPVPVPGLASGLRPVRRCVRPLHRRLTMILDRRTSPRLTWTSRLAVLAAAAIVLPISLLVQADDADPLAEPATPVAAQPLRAADPVAAETHTPVPIVADHWAPSNSPPPECGESEPAQNAPPSQGGAGGGSPAASPDISDTLRVFRLKYIAADDAGQDLASILGSRNFNLKVDPRTNSVLVYADEQIQKTVADRVAQLDRPGDADPAAATQPKPRETGTASEDAKLQQLEAQLKELQQQLRSLQSDDGATDVFPSSEFNQRPHIPGLPGAHALESTPAPQAGAVPAAETITVIRAHYAMPPALAAALVPLLEMIPGERDILLVWSDTRPGPLGYEMSGYEGGYGGMGGGYGAGTMSGYGGEMGGGYPGGGDMVSMMGGDGPNQGGLTVIATPEIQEVLRDFISVLTTTDEKKPATDDAGRQTFTLTRRRYRIPEQFLPALQKTLKAAQVSGPAKPVAINFSGSEFTITSPEALQAPLGRLIALINARHPGTNPVPPMPVTPTSSKPFYDSGSAKQRGRS